MKTIAGRNRTPWQSVEWYPRREHPAQNAVREILIKTPWNTFGDIQSSAVNNVIFVGIGGNMTKKKEPQNSELATQLAGHLSKIRDLVLDADRIVHQAAQEVGAIKRMLDERSKNNDG